MPRVTTAAATFLFSVLLCVPAVLRAQDDCDPACPPDQECFSGCGTLVQGVECVDKPKPLKAKSILWHLKDDKVEVLDAGL